MKKIKIVLFFSFSIALGAITGFIHPASSLIEASAPSKQGTIDVSPVAGSESTPKKEKETATVKKSDNSTKEIQTKDLPQKTYKVESGQTLWEIAKNNGLGIQDLMNRNQLTSIMIIEGQELIIE